jgi:ribosome-associated translation inhibitor RaiA
MSRTVTGPDCESIMIEVTGPVSQSERRYAAEKVHALAAYTHRPLRRAHVTITVSGNPSAAHRVHISVNLDVDGRTVHAEADGDNVRESMDVLRQRLYIQLARRQSLRARAYAWVSAPQRRS